MYLNPLLPGNKIDIWYSTYLPIYLSTYLPIYLSTYLNPIYANSGYPQIVFFRPTNQI